MGSDDLELEQRGQELLGSGAAVEDEILKLVDRRVLYLARKFFASWGPDTLAEAEQEARIGAVEAIRSYRPDRGPLLYWVDFCVERQLRDFMKFLYRLKRHNPHGVSVSLSKPVSPDEDGGDGLTLNDVVPCPASDPAEIVEKREELRVTLEIIRGMSVIERSAILMRAHGFTFQEIANALNISTKSVDNALNRAERKLIREMSQRGWRAERRTQVLHVATA